GRVLVQTRQPEHASLLAAARHDFPAFAAAELPARAALGYPPFSRLARVVLEGDLEDVDRAADAFGRHLRSPAAALAGGPSAAIETLGPAPAPLEKLRGRYRRQLLVKAQDSRLLRRLLAVVQPATSTRQKRSAPGGAVRSFIDVDPISML